MNKIRFRQYIPHDMDDHYAHFSKELFTIPALNNGGYNTDTTVDLMDAEGKKPLQRIWHPKFTVFFSDGGEIDISGFVPDKKGKFIHVRYRFFSESSVSAHNNRISNDKFVKAKLQGSIW